MSYVSKSDKYLRELQQMRLRHHADHRRAGAIYTDWRDEFKRPADFKRHMVDVAPHRWSKIKLLMEIHRVMGDCKIQTTLSIYKKMLKMELPQRSRAMAALDIEKVWWRTDEAMDRWVERRVIIKEVGEEHDLRHLKVRAKRTIGFFILCKEEGFMTPGEYIDREANMLKIISKIEGRLVAVSSVTGH